MNLREAPSSRRTCTPSATCRRAWCSPDGLDGVSGHGLAHLAHDGFDPSPRSTRTRMAIAPRRRTRRTLRAAVTNPAPGPRAGARLIDRAKKFGIRLYAHHLSVRGHGRERSGPAATRARNPQDFPDIAGFVLLTEGFWYKQWAAARGEQGARGRLGAELEPRRGCGGERGQVNPAIEILLGIQHRLPPVQRRDEKILHPATARRRHATHLGKRQGLRDRGLHGHLRDYGINVVGPAEVTEAQIAEAQARGCACIPTRNLLWRLAIADRALQPLPQQWHARYEKLAEFGIDGRWKAGLPATRQFHDGAARVVRLERRPTA